jgi:hypothetical protein
VDSTCHWVGERGTYRFGFLAPGGQWAACGTGPKFIPEALFFFFSFSVFLIPFIDFAKLLQMKSNHFQKFCKIQDKVLNQQQTCFQNQNNIFIKRS